MNDVGREHRQPHRPGDLARPYGFVPGRSLSPATNAFKIFGRSVERIREKSCFPGKKSPNTHRGCSGRSDRRIIMVYKRKDNYFIVVEEIEDTIEAKETCRQLISMRLLAVSCILAVGDSLLE